jgi:hypothetical protein
MKRKKRKKCFFSSSLFSFLPFRLDTNAEKKKIPMMHPTTTINKRRKKKEATKEKKNAKKFSSRTRRISPPRRRKREKDSSHHTHTQAFPVFYCYSIKHVSKNRVKNNR